MQYADQSLTAWRDRYLGLLGVTGPGAPTLALLTALTRAHVDRVQFENVTSILRREMHPGRAVPAPDPRETLEHWIEGRAGGVCFEVTGVFGELLRALGYNAYPILADISFPAAHWALIVELAGQRYLVDVGNGAPFFEPIPLEGTVEVHMAGLGFRFRPAADSDGIWLQERRIDGAWQDFVRYHLRPSSTEDREAALQRYHTLGQCWVVDELRMIRCTPETVWALRGQQLTRITATDKEVVHLADRDAYVRVAEEVFNLPRLPILAGLDALVCSRTAADYDHG